VRDSDTRLERDVDTGPVYHAHSDTNACTVTVCYQPAGSHTCCEPFAFVGPSL
jgi:hypothetical protein